MARPTHSDLSLGAASWKCESAKLGSRNFSIASVTPGTWARKPASSASTASRPIAARIGHSRSAM